MKKIYTLVLGLLFSGIGFSQIVSIPDANFKAKLLAAGPNNTTARNINNAYIKIDTNDDGEIQFSEALAVDELIVTANISDMTGIEAFTNLRELKCGNNNIASLDVSSCIQLKLLWCQGNELSSLNVSMLPNLIELKCYSNDITNLNVTGLADLEILECYNNYLVGLDLTGLTAIENIRCDNNHLTALDVSNLQNLQSLVCANNYITSIILEGAIGLAYFACSNNLITSLNLSDLSVLQDLNCSNNQISVLDFSGLQNLYSISCQNNQIITLDLSFCSNLSSLNCNNNLLTSLTGLSNNLGDINCTNNQLTYLDLSNCDNLMNIYCSYNQLQTIELDGMGASVMDFYCNNNQLTTLNLNAFSEMSEMDVSSNNLVSLFMKFDYQYGNIDDWDTFMIGNNLNLQYICANEYNFDDIQAKLNQLGYTNCELNDYCSFTPDGTFYTIQGNHRYDQNANGCDVTDTLIPNFKFSITNGSATGSIVSDDSGDFSIRVQAGTHTVTPVFEYSSYFTISPTVLNVTFPTQASPMVQDFCITANGVYPDLEIAIVPLGSPVPGFDADYKIIYKNKGTNTQSGSINFNFDDTVLNFVNSNPATDSQSYNNLNWNFSNLAPFASGEIFFTLNVNSPMETPPVNGGDILNSSVAITSAAIDETPTDNMATLSEEVVNSFDPNDKTCLEGGNITPEMIGNYVHYKIRFENTGTANAQRVIVSDKIDLSKFDIATLAPIDGSHAFTTRIYDGNKVEFIFENIQLPFDDANNDGYVVFKIKTLPTLVLGDSFSNSAAIYFDYNYPIFTNEAVTTIQVLGTSDFDFGNYFTLYPNPASDVLNIASKKEIALTSIAIYNTLGQLVLAVPNAQNVSSIDVSNLTSGNYFIKVASDKGSSSARFIKK